MAKDSQILYQMPGYLIRRCHQIAVSLFHAKCPEKELTPIQFAILWAIRNFKGCDQTKVAKLVGVDRTTTGNVIYRLMDRGYIERTADERDRRIKRLALTEKGEGFLDQKIPDVAKVQSEILSPLTADEQQQFVTLLTKVLETHNQNSRVPSEPGSTAN